MSQRVIQRFTSLDDEGFVRSFSDFEYTAYRLETLQEYDVTYERAEFQRFLAGEARGEFPGIQNWINILQQGIRDGKRFQRVHVLTEPLSDYVRFECAWAYRHNVTAGEDIRVIPVKQGEWPEGLPRQDYWLFDSRRLLMMNYSHDGTFDSADVVDDPADIVSACYRRDQAISSSMEFLRYAEGYDELMLERKS